ncbi:MAG: flagellar basal body P-ring formation protein FlgA [Candidatus Krumholzibacteriota bacterium]|nr:flagellar basal body P-ring formation protein FlgA [Candidatus Krumholzibacteriota bacterium]
MIRCLAATCVLLAALTASGAAGAAGAEALRLREAAACAGPELRLAELLAPGQDCALGDRVVARSPAPGRDGRISRRRLARLLADWGWRGRLDGPEMVRLDSPGVVLDLAPLARAVGARADSLLAAAGLRRAGELAGWPGELVLSSRRVRWQLALDGEPAGREARLGLELTDAAGFTARCRLRCRCARPDRVPVAVRALASGEALADWRWEERDLLAVDGEPLAAGALAGAVARRAVAAGEVLTRRVLAPPHLVTAGREVEIRLEHGAVTVSTRGVARGDGALGDLVTVKHLDGGALRRYRVVGPGRVAPAYR